MVDKAFTNDCFNQNYLILILRKKILHNSLKFPPKSAVPQFDGRLYQQTDQVYGDGLTILSSWPANGRCVYVPPRRKTRTPRYGTFSVQEICRRYSCQNAANTDVAAPNLKLTIERPADNMIPFIGIELINNGKELEACTCLPRKANQHRSILEFLIIKL